MVKTAILVSGGGTNLQAILDAHLFGEIPNCELTAVISSEPDAYALIRAQSARLPTYVVERSLFPNTSSFNAALLQKLEDLDIDLVVLAGYALPLGGVVLRAYEHRIISTFPGLLPLFSDRDGMTMAPYEAVLQAGMKLTGATAYFVTDGVGGPIIVQKAIEVLETDTPKTLQRRITEQGEWTILPQALALYCTGRLQVENNLVHITDVTN
jgi:phosphoribosylglycinamide formyltransferase-1